MSKIKDLKNDERFNINLVEIVELFSPDKKSKYTDLLLNLMKNTKALKEHSNEIVDNITQNFPFISKTELDKFSEIQILTIYKFLDAFFNTKDLKDYRRFCEYNERGIIDQNDLTRYKTFDDVINQLSVADLKAESKELETQIIKIMETDEYIVLRPLTYYASKKYGANTKWCTTQEGGEYFMKYSKRGVLIYIIGKLNGHKIAAFHSIDKNEPEHSWWDVKDKKIDSAEAKLPWEIRMKVEEVCFDPSAKCNHNMLSPEKKKREEALAKNRYVDLQQPQRQHVLGSRISEAIERENENDELNVQEPQSEIREMPVSEMPSSGSIAENEVYERQR